MDRGPRHVAIRELQTIGGRLTHKGRVVPDNFRKWIWEFLQPGVVRETAIINLRARPNEEAKRVGDLFGVERKNMDDVRTEIEREFNNLVRHAEARRLVLLQKLQETEKTILRELEDSYSEKRIHHSKIRSP